MENSLARLRQFIVEHYNLSELQTLCFDLGVNYDDLPGEALGDKARELILAMGRRNRLDRLLVYLQQNRSESFDFNTDPASLESFYAASPSLEDQAVNMSPGAPSSMKMRRRAPTSSSPPAGGTEGGIFRMDTTKLAPSFTIAQLFFNFVLAVSLAFILKGRLHELAPCAKPWPVGLSLLGILLVLLHLIWRHFGSEIKNIAGSIEIENVKIPIQALLTLFEALHPHPSMLPNKILWPFFFLILFIGIWILDLSPLPSPFRRPDETPIIQSFSIQYLDGPNVSLKPGEVVEIIANQQVLVEANTLQQAGLPCTWSATSGSLQPASGCSILYNAPFDEAQDTLSVLVQSSCMNRQAYESLGITIVQSGSSP